MIGLPTSNCAYRRHTVMLLLFFFFFSLISANAFYFHALTLFISFFLICIMHSAFNLFVFPNYMFTSLLLLLFVFLVYFL